MAFVFSIVKKISEKINPTAWKFFSHAEFLLSTKGKKNCTSMADESGVSHDKVYRLLEDKPSVFRYIPLLLVSLTRRFTSNKKSY